eukprot:ANDGO_07493.mRNA.1 hypothetical protein
MASSSTSSNDFASAPFDHFKGVMLSNRPGDSYPQYMLHNNTSSGNAPSVSDPLRNVFIPAGASWERTDNGLGPSRESRESMTRRSDTIKRSKSTDSITKRHKRWLNGVQQKSHGQLTEEERQLKMEKRKRFYEHQARLRRVFLENGAEVLKNAVRDPDSVAGVEVATRSVVVDQYIKGSGSPSSAADRSLSQNLSKQQPQKKSAFSGKQAKKVRNLSSATTTRRGKPAWALSKEEAESTTAAGAADEEDRPSTAQSTALDIEFEEDDVQNLLEFVGGLNYDAFVDEYDAFESKISALDAEIVSLERVLGVHSEQAASSPYPDFASVSDSGEIPIVVQNGGLDTDSYNVKIAHNPALDAISSPQSTLERKQKLEKLKKQRSMLAALVEKKRRSRNGQMAEADADAEKASEAERKKELANLVKSVFSKSKTASRVHSKQSLAKVAFAVGQASEEDKPHRSVNADMLKQLKLTDTAAMNFHVQPTIAVHSAGSVPSDDAADRRKLIEERRKQPSLLPYLHRCPSV